jgi:hypothetical protein
VKIKNIKCPPITACMYIGRVIKRNVIKFYYNGDESDGGLVAERHGREIH